MADPRALSERELLARAIQSEAGGEPYTGQVAVGAVIDNRRRSGGYGGSSYGDVILAPGQFSAFNGYTGYAGGAGANDVWQRTPSDTSYQAADEILSGQYEDPTGGALNYYNPAAASPSWGGGDSWQRIGNHVFGTAGQGGGGGRGGGGGSGGYTRSTKGSNMEPDASQWDQIIAAGGQTTARSPLANALMAFAQNAPAMYKGQGMDFAPFASGGQGKNKTVQWLVQSGRKDLAAAVASGALDAKEAMSIAYREGAKDGKTYTPISDEEAKELGLDPGKKYQRSSDGQITSIGGGGVEVNVGGTDLKESEGKATMYYAMMENALPTINKLEGQGLDIWQNIAPTMMQSPEFRTFENAAMQYTESLLRLNSGGVIGEDEVASYRRMWFPMPGDPPDEVNRKRQAREDAKAAIMLVAGPGIKLYEDQKAQRDAAAAAAAAASGSPVPAPTTTAPPPAPVTTAPPPSPTATSPTVAAPPPSVFDPSKVTLVQ